MSVIRPFDPWKSRLCTCPPKYTLNPYTGCSHRCLYCYATSYIGYRESTPKKDIIRRVMKDLERINYSLPINLSTSSDPYPPIEEKVRITRKVLELLIRNNCKILITTKSNLVVKDLDLISVGRVAVSITITYLDENLVKKIEPNAPSPRERLRAIEELVKHGVPVSVRIDPIIPYINDDDYVLRELVCTLHNLGVKHVVTSTYKARPDNFKRVVSMFPEVENRLRRLYYNEGFIVHRYRYLRKEMREKLLKPIISEARRLGMEYATCREGLKSSEWFNAKSCDGTHLIPE